MVQDTRMTYHAMDHVGHRPRILERKHLRYVQQTPNKNNQHYVEQRDERTSCPISVFVLEEVEFALTG